MRDRGYSRDATQCCIKLKEPRQAYQKTKESNGCSGTEPQACRFYAELHAILGGAATTTPPLSVDSDDGVLSATPEDFADGEDEEEDELEESTQHTVLHDSQDLFITLTKIPSQPNQAGEGTYVLEGDRLAKKYILQVWNPDDSDATIQRRWSRKRKVPSSPQGGARQILIFREESGDDVVKSAENASCVGEERRVCEGVLLHVQKASPYLIINWFSSQIMNIYDSTHHDNLLFSSCMVGRDSPMAPPAHRPGRFWDDWIHIVVDMQPLPEPTSTAAFLARLCWAGKDPFISGDQGGLRHPCLATSSMDSKDSPSMEHKWGKGETFTQGLSTLTIYSAATFSLMGCEKTHPRAQQVSAL
ncbi:hypothetical protein UY3_16156 [Chelonia mydas]|uniref:Uncharacterized protein n=1 Tax=Chelonia mydas TaxID=8469 RepID=M7ANE7_CHEMY|nr:hypothetical protein UY3_16156 [Chelonia mydas]